MYVGRHRRLGNSKLFSTRCDEKYHVTVWNSILCSRNGNGYWIQMKTAQMNPKLYCFWLLFWHLNVSAISYFSMNANKWSFGFVFYRYPFDWDENQQSRQCRTRVAKTKPNALSKFVWKSSTEFVDFSENRSFIDENHRNLSFRTTYWL